MCLPLPNCVPDKLHKVVDQEHTGEMKLLSPLLRWLGSRGRVNDRSTMSLEFYWLGRHVDLVTLSASGIAVAYELKLGSLGRALEQAALNRLTFNRSYVVTASCPRPDNRKLAEDSGVGIIVIKDNRVRQLVASPTAVHDRIARHRLMEDLRAMRGKSV